MRGEGPRSGGEGPCVAGQRPFSLASHQQDAAARALALIEHRGGVLLADEVGLGKSFVAAAVARTLQERGFEIECIVPASLVAQWKSTLREFGVDARMLTHDGIVSDPFVADPERRRLLVVDEAHVFRNPHTQRYAALARRTLAAALLLVTATPICNSADDLGALIALLAADDALRDAGVGSIEEAFRRRDAAELAVIVGELVIRRDRDVLPDALRFGDLERRVVRHPVIDARIIDDLQFPLFSDAALLRRTLWRRAESSPAALRESLTRQLRFYERALDALQRGRALTKRDYRRAFAGDDRDALQQVLFWEVFTPPQAPAIDAPAIEEEMRRIEALHAMPFDDAKRDLLRRVLDATPTLVFTSAIATARDLHEAFGGGLVTSQTRAAALHAFTRGKIDLLIATDLASEGLNLQRAGVVVHYDIPWNPVRLDQRNGRAHRIGQQRPSVRAIYFLPDRTSTPTHIVETVAAKNRVRRKLMSGATVAGEPTALPAHIAKDSPQAALIRRGIDDARLARRYRAGIERLMAEMSGEALDDVKLAALWRWIDAEQCGTSIASSRFLSASMQN